MRLHPLTSFDEAFHPTSGYQGFSLTPTGSPSVGCFESLVRNLRNLKRFSVLDDVMAGPVWKNIYRLSDEQIANLDEAEDKMEMMDINGAEEILLAMLEDDANCVPVLNNLAHMNGRYLSDFEKAVEFYDRVLEIEPDNAWARDERRRYQRYLTYD
tara:strand:+ start:856 stop:1323 length:468 start_codon:yes stop_codon:yes gene_type:complete